MATLCGIIQFWVCAFDHGGKPGNESVGPILKDDKFGFSSAKRICGDHFSGTEEG
jgi:hypothetical protein